MLNQLVDHFVEWQIKNGVLRQEDKPLYQYGYHIMIEYSLNVLAAVIIAVLFQAFEIVIVFTIAFMLLRSYAGGYHADSGLKCFLLSALMQIIVILLIQQIGHYSHIGILYFSELLMLPYVFIKAPVAAKKKPLSENERKVFGKRVKIIYIVELLVCICLRSIWKEELSLSILFAHIMIFILMVHNSVTKKSISE